MELQGKYIKNLAQVFWNRFTPFNNKKIKMMGYWICNLLHGVNEDALCYEFDLLDISYQRQLELDVHYKNVVFDKKFRADLLVEKKILVENKAIKKITNQDEAQLINYLKTTQLKVGLLFNFGADKFEMIRRIF